ncbi:MULTISPECIES: PHP domain-containing protein [Desulfococcus]|nr:PHP domain-containing protein [Desulfococcus multivorans]AOY57378.1 PHP domain protein [Desulfococcus multivorans]
MDCKGDVMVDLHVHSTASDGTHTPAELILRAEAIGLKAFAITDHDTVAGARAAAAAGIPASMHFFTGVEISAAFPRFYPARGSFHVLGYGMRLDDPAMENALALLRTARRNRNPDMVERLRNLGMDISMDELHADAGNVQVGRPHIARLMIRKGYVKTFDEAFDRYIGAGRPAYVDKYRIECETAIGLIRNAGGIAVLAHPGLLPPADGLDFEELVRGLTDLGLGGIEVYYPSHSPAETALYRKTAERFGLVATGGTDYHGAISPGIDLGVGDGTFSVPCEVHEKLSRALGRICRETLPIER